MKKGFWTGLLILMIIYTLVYLFFYEAPYFQEIPRRIKHLIKIIILLTVYFTGSYHLKLNQIRWMQVLWHFIHLSGISVIVIFGIYDLVINPIPDYIRTFLGSISEFLVSPVLFVVMGILYKRMMFQQN